MSSFSVRFVPAEFAGLYYDSKFGFGQFAI